MKNLSVFEELKYASILQLVNKDTVIDANWLPYLMSSKSGKQVLKAMKKVSSLSSYQLILELHEGWKIDNFIKYYI